MAHQEAVHVGNSAALTAHTGTAGTAEMIRVVATSAGALSVDIVGTEPINLVAGTITEVSEVASVSAGTLEDVTITGGTVDEVTSANIASGSIAVVAGTVGDATVTSGSIAVVAGTVGDATVTSGSIAVIAGTIGDATVTSGSITVIAGTVTGDWASFTGTVTIPTSDTVTSGTLASTIDGLIRGITVVTPDMEGTDQTTVRLIDGLGGTVVGLAAQNESAITFYGTTQPITTAMEWTATAAGTQGAAKDITIQVHYEK